MAHHEITFPLFEAWQHEGGPGGKTAIIEMQSGQERAIAQRERFRRRYSVSMQRKKTSQINELLTFYKCRGGLSNSFNYFDPRDHHSGAWAAILIGQEVVSPTDQNIGTGDGTTTNFQLVKRYIDGAATHVRPILKPITGTVRVALDGVEQMSGWTVNTTTGIVTFTSAPSAAAVVTAGFQFLVPVRFGIEVDDLFAAVLSSPDMAEVVSVPLIEVMFPTSSVEDRFLGGARNLTTTTGGVITLDFSATVWRIAVGTTKLLLPDLSTAPEGGPIFAIAEAAGSTPALKTHDDATLVHTFTANEHVEVWAGFDSLGAKTWLVF